MGVKCYVVEPVFGDEDSLPYDRGWDPQGRVILRWRRPDTGEEKQWPHQFGPGAMFFAIWQPKNWDWKNEDGPHLNVVGPNGQQWDIDSRCSNCELPNDKEHRCWVRHGAPPNVTVNKAGRTCAAGAGSIVLSRFEPPYHGFLTNGEFNP